MVGHGSGAVASTVCALPAHTDSVQHSASILALGTSQVLDGSHAAPHTAEAHGREWIPQGTILSGEADWNPGWSRVGQTETMGNHWHGGDTNSLMLTENPPLALEKANDDTEE